MERPFPAYKGDDPYIFVCYAHDDSEMVYPEIIRLRDQGFNIWYDEGISPGSTWRDEVALALTQCKVFLYFVSPRSVTSTNCLKEVNFCLSRERKILPVYLEKTDLPMGLELSLSDTQAIVRNDHSEEAYLLKLSDSLISLLPNIIEPVTTSEIEPAETVTNDTSIAILPLVNRSNDPDNEYLCDGVTEELIGGLAGVDQLEVASQLSSFALKNQNLDARAIGEKLDVGHILSGSVQKAGNRVRISVLLSTASDGKTLWSERYDHELDDIFELQEDVARQVIDALKVELDADHHVQLVDAGTQSVQAYDAFLLGVYEHRKQTRQSYEQAIIRFQQATQLDPGFGRAFWSLYQCHWQLIYSFGIPKGQMASEAEEALNRAKENGFVPPYPWIQAWRELYPDTRPDQRTLALEACDRIRQPDPEWQAYEHLQFGDCLTAAGLFHAALDYTEYYLDRSHHDVGDESTHGYLLSHLGRFDRAIDLWTERLGSQPDNLRAMLHRALLYSRTGQYQKAEQDLVELSRVAPRNFAQFYHLYWHRELDAAKEYFEWLESRENLPINFKCWGCLLLGDIEGGLNYAEQAANREIAPTIFRATVGAVLPQSILREVEQHPRFQVILTQLGIDDTWRDELIEMANDLSAISGIYVQLDEDY